MITLGIDLATEPSGTAACRIDWHTLHLDVIDERLTDDALIDLIAGASMTGIDVPLGWPDPFIDAVVGHRVTNPGSTENAQGCPTDSPTTTCGQPPASHR